MNLQPFVALLFKIGACSGSVEHVGVPGLEVVGCVILLDEAVVHFLNDLVVEGAVHDHRVRAVIDPRDALHRVDHAPDNLVAQLVRWVDLYLLNVTHDFLLVVRRFDRRLVLDPHHARCYDTAFNCGYNDF